MHHQNHVLKIFGVILMLAILAACAPTATKTPASVPTTPATAPSTPMPTLTPTPTPWQASADWWTKPQVQAFGQPLFAAYVLPETEIQRPDYFLDVYSKAGVTLVNWGDIRWADNWREIYPGVVEELHSRHMIVVGTISLTYALTESAYAQELQPAALRDPYGNILYEFQLGDTYALSIIHPAYQEYMLSLVKMYIDAGVDGILVDEMAFGVVHYPDFNENTMLEFRQYLLDTYSSEELAAFGQQYGVADFNTLDYAALARASLPSDRTSITRQDWQWDLYSQIPFFVDYQRFVRIKNREFALWLIEEGKTYARDKYGRDLPFSANLSELTSPEALYLIDALDYVDLENHYQSMGYFPKARAVTTVRIAQAFGKRPYLVTSYGGTDPDIAARGIARSTNLFRIMIAEGYGTGAAFAVEEGLHEIKQDINALAPYYRFPRDYPYLFEDMKPVKGQVGLLYLWESRDIYNHTDLRGLGQMLVDSGYQFNIIFGAEEFTWWGTPNIYPASDHPLTLEALTPYPIVIVPELDDITPNHVDILLQYVRHGGRLVVFTNPDHINTLTYHRGQSEPLVEELLEYVREGNAEVGEGRIVTVAELWGRAYTADPQPAMRQPLEDLLAAENVLPEVSMSPVNYVGAFMHQSPDSLTVYFVNYDYDPETDRVASTAPVEITITLPDGFDTNNLSIHYYSPGEEPQTFTGNLNGNQYYSARLGARVAN
jgi:hypothetical protein